MEENNKLKIAALIFFAFIIGLAGGYFDAFRLSQKNQQQVLGQVKSIREKDINYKFINPLLAYDLPESSQFGEYTELSKSLNDLIAQEKNQHKIDQVSIYFRGSQGRWVGINDADNYYPASLLKVVVMIAYYQQAQANPAILDKQLEYTPKIQNEAASTEFSTPSMLKLNSNYRIDDLIQNMIINSDNGAAYTLIDSLDGKALDEVYSDLGLNGPNNANYEISAKDYSLFFRILYNATYLNREYSEKALSLLSKTTFKDGLVGGMPSGTVIAHKYGEHIITDNSGTQTAIELHDCGLVYAKQNILLCVMTRGQKVEDLEQTIKDISSLVYQQSEK
jgi:beta-lactamase class A